MIKKTSIVLMLCLSQTAFADNLNPIAPEKKYISPKDVKNMMQQASYKDGVNFGKDVNSKIKNKENKNFNDFDAQDYSDEDISNPKEKELYSKTTDTGLVEKANNNYNQDKIAQSTVTNAIRKETKIDKNSDTMLAAQFYMDHAEEITHGTLDDPNYKCTTEKHDCESTQKNYS